VSSRVPAMIDAAKSLRRVENLLDQALAAITGKNSTMSCTRCASVLAEVNTELKSLTSPLIEFSTDRAALLPHVAALLPRIGLVKKLLATAAEFYGGWCAAGTAPGNAALGGQASGYQTETWSCGPALLAFEG